MPVFEEWDADLQWFKPKPRRKAGQVTAFLTCAQMAGMVLALGIATDVFLNRATDRIGALLPDYPRSLIQATISGVGSLFFDNFDPDTRRSVSRIVARNLSKVFYLNLAGFALGLDRRLPQKKHARVPEVGATYDDHHASSSPYRSSLDIRETLDGFVNGKFDIPALMGSNDEILGWNGLEVTGKLRPNASDVASLGPDFEAEWSQTFANNPNKPMVGLTLVASNAGDPSKAPIGQYFTHSVFNLYP
ncbi:hypothetical protein ANO14919_079510 [Xylariales sp. No.14919]|nr:hypothetical protein ANO14919_079510 [Xylariales sp. No.14919]